MTSTIKELVLTHKYRTLYPTIARCTFFLSIQGSFSRIGHMLDYRMIVNKL